MKSSQNLTIFTFLALLISSFAQPEYASQAPLASGGPYISVSPATSPSPSPLPGPSGPALGLTTGSSSGQSTPTLRAGSSLKEWCNSTDYPDLCESAIAPFMEHKPDLFRAIEIAIKSAVSTTKMAILAATKIANSPLTPQELANILKDSLDSFNDALYNYKEAQNALPTRDWGTVNTMLSGAISDFGDCEDQLMKHDVPGLMEFTDKLTKMTSNCLALSALFDPPPGFY